MKKINQANKVLAFDKINMLNNCKNVYIMIYKLYGLTYEEVKVVDSAFALTKEEYENYKIE